MLQRSALTALPSVVAFIWGMRSAGQQQANTVAFSSIVMNQLAQTYEAGRTEGGLSRPVFYAVLASAALTVSVVTLGPLRTVLRLSSPTRSSWLLIAASAAVAGRLSHQKLPVGRHV